MHAYLTADYCGTTDANGNPITNCPGTAQAPSGTELPTTPKFKGNLDARYTIPLGTWQGFVEGNIVYQSAVWPDLRIADREVLGQQPAYAISNFFMGVTSKDNLQLEFLIKNLTDKRASIYRYAECTQTTCGPIAVYNVVAPPRLFGIQLTQRFQ
jgi:iron complex outermembrane receptor protein